MDGSFSFAAILLFTGLLFPGLFLAFEQVSPVGEIALESDAYPLCVLGVVVEDIDRIGPVKGPQPVPAVLGQDIFDIDVADDGAGFAGGIIGAGTHSEHPVNQEPVVEKLGRKGNIELLPGGL